MDHINDLKSIKNTENRVLKNIIIIFAATLLITLSFLLAYKAAVAIYPFNTGQQIIIDYLQSPAQMENSLFVAGASMKEIEHLYDVVQLMFLIDLLIIPELLISALLLLTAWQLGRKTFKSTLKLAGFGGLSFAVIFGIAAGFFFDNAFEIFHKFFFPQGNYQFATDSYLIQTLPGEVFFQIGLLIFLISVIINIGYLLGSYLIRKRKRLGA